MESSTGNSQCLTTSANNTNSSSTISITSPPSANTSSATASTTTTTLAASSTVIASSSSTAAASISSTSNLTATGNLTSVTSAPTAAAAAVVHPHTHHHQPYHTPLLQILPFDIGKQDDSNNLSLASGLSEGQRSLSAAPSASSSPILSPPGKIFGRNANGTMVATSRPSNEAEIQLYRVLQKASLLAYYDTLLEMGGDDVQQLYEAGEEEFLEIMALVGMASKPLHVRRLQKALHEWALNPTQFQQSLANNSAQFETPAKSSPVLYNIEPSPSHMVARPKFQTFTTTTPTFNPTPLTNTAPPSTSAHILSQICSLPPLPAHKTPSYILPSNLATHDRPHTLPSNPSLTNPLNTSHQVTSSSPQLTPVLSEMQVARITMGAEKIASQLPQREPRAHTLKKRTNRELEQVIAMSENDPRRMDEIRKYSAIYGRFDCKRRPEKPLTLHEVCVNEAAAQLCRLVPALLTRRDELFPLARQIVKDAGFGHSATIARYGNLLSQMSAGQTSSSQARSSSSAVDCESSESNLTPLKRQRLSSSEASLTASDSNRDSLEDPRYNLFAMYQKFAAKPPFDLTDIAKFTLNKQSSEFEDQDQESRFSFSNSSSPSIPNTGPEEEDRNAAALLDKSFMKSDYTNNNSLDLSPSSNNHSLTEAGTPAKNLPLPGDVQVISAAGNHIIAVANPALVMSPTLNETISLKRETNSPDL